MTDTQVAETETSVAERLSTNAVQEPTEAPAEKPAKTPKPKNPCGCRAFVAFDKSDPTAEFDTACTAETERSFTQGHDARAASFLVQAELDGYGIKSADGSAVYDGAVDAATKAGMSEALVGKITRAVENGKAKEAAKAQRAADREKAKQERAAAKEKAKAEAAAAKEAKASGPKDVAASVVPGSQEGDAPVGRSVVVKIGKNEYDGELSEDGKTVVYKNNQGEEQTRDVDTVRILSRS